MGLRVSRAIIVPLLSFLLLASGIIGTGAVFYLSEKHRFLDEKQNELLAVSNLKIDMIHTWRDERIADASFFSENPFFSKQFESWMASDIPYAFPDDMAYALRALQKRHDYYDILLTDLNGKVLFSLKGTTNIVSSDAHLPLKIIARTRQIQVVDFHHCPISGRISTGIVAPIFTYSLQKPLVIGLLIFVVDPYPILYPLIQTWPTPSSSAETLLVRRDGNDVLFLNELRFRTHTALSLRLPINSIHLPAAMAVRGINGIVTGLDYRDIEVLAAISPIPDTPWFIVAKRDIEEIWAPFRARMLLMGMLTVSLVVVIGLVVLFWAYRRHLESERERQALVQHFDYLSKYANDVILLADEHMGIVEINDRALETYGYTRDEMLQMKVTDLRSISELVRFDEQRLRIEQEKSLVYETVHRRKDGSTFPVEVSIRVIEWGGTKCYQPIIRDITERKRSEESLRTSELRHRQTLDNMIEGCQILGFDWRYLYVNASAARHGRAAREELLGHTMIEKYPGIENTPLFASLQQCMSKRISQSMENLFVYPDGSSAWFDLSIQPAPEGLFILSLDVTERKRIEQEREITLQFLRLINSSTDTQDLIRSIITFLQQITGCHAIGIRLHEGEDFPYYETRGFPDDFVRKENSLCARDQAGAILHDEFGNPVIECMCGNILCGRFDPSKPFFTRSGSFWTNSTTDLLASTTEADRQARTRNRCNGEGYESVALIPLRLGTECLGLLQLNDRRKGLFSPEGIAQWERLTGYLAVALGKLRAEENLHKLNEELEARVLARTAEVRIANEELEAFSYSVSHDLRAPLRAIDGFSRILVEDFGNALPPETRRYLDIIIHNVQGMTELIDDLLNFSRLSRQSMNRQNVRPDEIVQTVLEELTNERAGRDIEIVRETLPPCLADPALLKQVYVNLLSNALKYTRKQPHARIEIGAVSAAELLRENAELHEPHVSAKGTESDRKVYYVRDNGTGFDMRYVGKLFGVFQRLHRAEEFEGTGVGLAIVHRIVLRHGGRVWAEGELDRGATFYFWL